LRRVHDLPESSEMAGLWWRRAGALPGLCKEGYLLFSG